MIENNDSRVPLLENLTAGPESQGLRLDTFLARQVENLSRSRAQKLIEEGQASINRASCVDKNYRLQEGDLVSLSIPLPGETSVEAEDIQLQVVYEDADLLVIDKPRGMVVHPAPGHSGGTLVNALLGHCNDLSGIGGVARPGIVHRLDKDTSGLLIAAKNDLAHRSLSEQLKSRKLHREYIALVHGLVTPKLARIEAPIARHPRHRKKMAVVAGGREAITRYRVVKYYSHYSLLRLNLETGRTHQIRVHLANLGYPVVGDTIYAGGGKGNLPPEMMPPQALHARHLAFIHPRSGEELKLSAPLPAAFKNTLRWLNNN